jgi:putative DNA base modification enzyme with NMAD domain
MVAGKPSEIIMTATLFSYVVEHDKGHAPNPYFGVCTLCRCKCRASRKANKNVVELAKPGDWVIGTGGSNRKRSAGHGKLVYAMQVEQKLTREEYYASGFESKKRVKGGSRKQLLGDNILPKNSFERQQRLFVLISIHRFYYFGKNAISIPLKKFPGLEKRGPGFKRKFDPAFIARFVRWITRQKRGVSGEPCMKGPSARRGTQVCKSFC